MTAYVDGTAYLLRASAGAWVALSTDDLYRMLRAITYYGDELGAPLYVIPAGTITPILADLHVTSHPIQGGHGDVWHEVTVTGQGDDAGTVYDRLGWSAHPVEVDQ